jgi:methionyl-tRNA formyltransferase
MDAGVDTGDIVAQAAIEVLPDDTAHTLYARLLDLEFELFRSTWPLLASGQPPRMSQSPEEGTSHNRAELGTDTIRRLDLDASTSIGAMLKTLRALTTSDIGEAAYFEEDGTRYRVQITITPEDTGEETGV